MCFLFSGFPPLHLINMRNNPDDPMRSFSIIQIYVCNVLKIFLFFRLLMPINLSSSRPDHVLRRAPPETPEHALSPLSSHPGDGYGLLLGRARSLNCTEGSGLSATLVSGNSLWKTWKMDSPHFFRSRRREFLSVQHQALKHNALPIHSKVVKQTVAL